MTNKPIILGIISIVAAFLIWGYQTLGKLMSQEGAGVNQIGAEATLYLSNLFDTQALESSAYLSFLATTPLYLLLIGLGVLFLLIGAIIQK